MDETYESSVNYTSEQFFLRLKELVYFIVVLGADLINENAQRRR